MYIGENVKLTNPYGEILSGVLTEVLSDSYDDVRLENGKVEYWSKKKKQYVPIKEKHKNSIFFEVQTDMGFEYILKEDIVKL